MLARKLGARWRQQALCVSPTSPPSPGNQLFSNISINPGHQHPNVISIPRSSASQDHLNYHHHHNGNWDKHIIPNLWTDQTISISTMISTSIVKLTLNILHPTNVSMVSRAWLTKQPRDEIKHTLLLLGQHPHCSLFWSEPILKF